MSNHGIIEANGTFGSITAHCGWIWLTMTNPYGATVIVEASHDDGVTWNVHHEILPKEYQSHSPFVRPYRVTQTTLMRMRVTGFVRQFKYWLEQRS